MSKNSASFAFFGTPGVAATTLERLVGAGLVPNVIVTAPAAPRGRGLVLTPSETRVVAEQHAIPVVTPEKLDAAAIAEIKKYACAYAVVVAYGKIFPQELIDSFPKGAINVHYSLLPKYRGATPMEAALLGGDAETGVTIQQLTLELDAGDILVQEATPISPDETARELRLRLIELGAQMLVDFLPRFEAGEYTRTAQDPALATHAKKFKKADGELDPSSWAGQAAPVEENWRKYRAYADTIGTFFFKDGVRHKITKASFKDGYFKVERVIPEGKREQDY